MAISSTRVRFLDKENKVLVKPIKDFTSNAIFSDFVTSFLDSDLVSGFLGQQNLLSLQSGLAGFSSFINDLNVAAFSVENFLKDLDFTSPALAHLSATMTALKAMDNKTMGIFAQSMLDVVTDKLIDNPSLMNLYNGVTSDVKAQTLLASLEVFSARLSKGEVTLTAFTNQLKEAGVSAVDLTKVNTLLNAIKANTKVIDLAAIVPGDPKLGEGFLEGLTDLEVEEEEEEIVGGGDDGDDGDDNGITPPDETTLSELKVTDPDIQDILVAYLSVKRVYVLAHLKLTATVYQDPSFLSYVQTNAGKAYLTEKLTGDVKVDPVRQAEVFILAISFLLGHIQGNSSSSEPLTTTQLTDIFTTITTAINSALDFLLADVKTMTDTTFAVAGPIGQTLLYINEPDYTGTPPLAFPGFVRNEVIEGLQLHRDNLATVRMNRYFDKPGAVINGDKAGEILAYTCLQIVKHLIQNTQKQLTSYYALSNAANYALVSIYGFVADAGLATKGFTLGAAMVVEGPVNSHKETMGKLYNTIAKSTAASASLDSIPVAEKPFYLSLKSFNEAIKTAIGEPSATVDYDTAVNLLNIYDIYKDSTRALDALTFAIKAVTMDQVAFSATGDAVSIL